MEDTTALQLRDSAQQAIANIKTIESGVEYLNKVKAIEVWAKAEKKDAELQNMIAEQKIRTQRVLGRLIREGQEKGEIAKQSTGRPICVTGGDTYKTLPDLGITRNQSSTFKAIESIPENDFESMIEKGKDEEIELTTAFVYKLIKKEEALKKVEAIRQTRIENPDGKYDVIVIDPPWPMEKIERDCAPNQHAFDYPTMAEAELENLAIPAAESCHLFTWTTQRFLPMALRLTEKWGFRYVCLFVWHKPGGFQPFGLPQYNAEFVVYARKGTPKFSDTKAFNICFDAPRGAHSEKPEAFYETLRRVTEGLRIDMFNRRPIDGFDGWGNESE